MDVHDIPPENTELMHAFRECSQLFTAIGDENRQALFCALIVEPGQRVEDLRAHTNPSRPAVSHHLKVLKDAGIVKIIRKGTKNFYFLSCDTDVWRKSRDLTAMMCDLAEKISGDPNLETRMEMMIDEHDC